jgi:3-phenylpropionate/cinnamic acid dioxygenase small subunit
MDPVLQRLLDHDEIIQTLHRYAFALDDRDWDLLETVFTPDAVGEYSGQRYEGFPAILEMISGVLGRIDRTQHLIGNATVWTYDGDTATTRCYLHGQHTIDGLPGGDNNVLAGEYRDRFVRTPDGWSIAHRSLKITWREGNPAVNARD